MIVDNKIELEIKFLRDFPDWQFLPKEDLNRKTIEIYFDIKNARKYCNKDQKVIKVPNTNVFDTGKLGASAVNPNTCPLLNDAEKSKSDAATRKKDAESSTTKTHQTKKRKYKYD
mgnify:CR=1 FL=1